MRFFLTERDTQETWGTEEGVTRNKLIQNILMDFSLAYIVLCKQSTHAE